MKHFRYHIIIILLLCTVIAIQVYRTFAVTAPCTPKEEVTLLLETKDVNKDGKPDNWLYRDGQGIPVKWIRDSNGDGRPDRWSYFQDGKAFIDQEAINHDGKVNSLTITLRDSVGTKQRYVSLVLKNGADAFELQRDTGWVTEEEFKKMQ